MCLPAYLLAASSSQLHYCISPSVVSQSMIDSSLILAFYQSDKTVINIPCEESLKARNNPASIVLNMPVDDPSTGQELPMLPLQVVGTTNVRFTSPIQTGVPVPQIHAPPQRSVAVDKKPAAVRKVRSTWTTQVSSRVWQRMGNCERISSSQRPLPFRTAYRKTKRF